MQLTPYPEVLAPRGHQLKPRTEPELEMCLVIVNDSFSSLVMEPDRPLSVVRRTCTVGLPRESSRCAAVIEVMYEGILRILV